MTKETTETIDARKLRDRFVALADIELAGAEPLHTAMQTVAETAAELLPAAGVLVLVPGEDGRHAVVGSHLDPGLPLNGFAVDVAGMVLAGEQPLFVPALAGSPAVAAPALPAPGKSLAALPILGTEGPLGALVAIDTATDAFGEDDRVFLDMLARRSAGAIVSARLIDASRAAGERSEALAWVANALIGTGDLPDVLRAVVEGVAASLAAARVSLVTVDPDQRRLVDQVHGGLESTGDETTTYDEFMAGAPGWVVRERRLAVTRASAAHPGEQAAAHADRTAAGFGPMISAPLSGSGDLAGALTVMRRAEAPDFDTAEVNLVLAMANQATVGIDNIRLNLATRRTLQVTEAMYAFSRALTQAETLPDVLAAVASGTKDALPAAGVAVFLLSRGGEVADAAVAGAVPLEMVGKQRELPPLARRAVAADRPLRRSRSDDSAAVVAAPIRAHQRVVGAIVAVDDGARPDFGARHIDVLVALAAQAGTAIDNVRLFEEVQRLAITDDLTGIHNRRHLFELADHEFAQAQRYHRPLAAIMFDLDHFKEVNDRHGHAVGDEVLCAVARVCDYLIREVDVLGRYGGEEFAVLLPETDLKAALEVAERFREAVAAETIDTNAGPIAVTVSAGVAEIHPDMIDVHELINRADAAMYFAKRSGRNRVEGG